MGIKDILSSFGSKGKEKKALIRNIEDQMRAEKIAEDRLKSSNERELERFIKEEREERIKEELDFHRKKRQDDINFGNNPLSIPNITNHSDWEVLKERNMFKGQKNMFANQPSVLKGNPNLFKSNNNLMNNGNVLKNNVRLI